MEGSHLPLLGGKLEQTSLEVLVGLGEGHPHRKTFCEGLDTCALVFLLGHPPPHFHLQKTAGQIEINIDLEGYLRASNYQQAIIITKKASPTHPLSIR